VVCEVSSRCAITKYYLCFQVCSSETPCCEFYQCSKVKLKTLEEDAYIPTASAQLAPKKDLGPNFDNLNCAIDLGITLVILWQVSIKNN